MKKQGRKLLVSMVCIVFVFTTIITSNPATSGKVGDKVYTCGDPRNDINIE